METLVHPDAPELEFTPANDIEAAAYRSQGFVEKDKFVAASKPSADSSDEVAELKEKLSAAEAEVRELKKELKTERAKNTREANKAADEKPSEQPSDQETPKEESEK